MNSEETDENKEQINDNKETNQETEEKEIALNLEENKQIEKRRELNLLDTEEQQKKKPSCKCACVLF